MMTDSLHDHIAIISGGLGEIGRAMAIEFAARGADGDVGDTRDASAAHPLARIRGAGRRAKYDHVDVSDALAVQNWVQAVEADLGPPTLIIPNAAIVHVAPLPQLTPEVWRRELAVNLDGAFYLAHAEAQRLVALGKPGRIIFIGSWAGHAVHPPIPTYCVSKAGLRMLMKCMAAEYSPHGILVAELAPGYVNAGLSGRFFEADPGSADAARKTVPVRELIEAEEVARQAAWLCDPANRHISGTALIMDGGLSLFGHGGQRPEPE